MMPLSTLSLLPASSALAGASPQPAADGAAFALLLPAGITAGTMRQANAEGGKGLPATTREDDDPADCATMAWFAPPLWDAASPPIAPAPVPGEVALAPPITSGGASALTIEPRAGMVSAPMPSIGKVGARTDAPDVAAAGMQIAAPAQPVAGSAAPMNGATMRGAMLSTTATPAIADQPFPTAVPAVASSTTASVIAPAALADAAPTLAAGTITRPGGQPSPEAHEALAENSVRPDVSVSDAHAAKTELAARPARDVASATLKPSEGARPSSADADNSAAPAAIMVQAADEHPTMARVHEAPRRAAGPAADPQLAATPVEIPAQENADVAPPLGRATDPATVIAAAAAPVPSQTLRVTKPVLADRQLAASPVLAPVAGKPVGQATADPATPAAAPMSGIQLSPAATPPMPDQRTPVIAPVAARPAADLAQSIDSSAAAMPGSDPLPVDGKQGSSSIAGAARSITKDLPAAATSAPVVAAPPAAEPAPAARIAPAAQIFAAAMHQMFRDERRADPADPTSVIIAGAGELGLSAAGPVDGIRHAAIDMAREAWPAKMIERIEMIRDALNATDTSIRLVPDKLGAIDVSLRQDGDQVQVQFTAQQAETRQLLTDAQPKLAELAEAKGLKLSAQFGDGGGQAQAQSQSQHQQRAPSGAQTSNLRPGRAASNDDAGTLADERIA